MRRQVWQVRAWHWRMTRRIIRGPLWRLARVAPPVMLLGLEALSTEDVLTPLALNTPSRQLFPCTHLSMIDEHVAAAPDLSQAHRCLLSWMGRLPSGDIIRAGCIPPLVAMLRGGSSSAQFAVQAAACCIQPRRARTNRRQEPSSSAWALVSGGAQKLRQER